MKSNSWNVRFNAPKPERDSEKSTLDPELNEVSLSDDDSVLGGVVPDSDPNRPTIS